MGPTPTIIDVEVVNEEVISVEVTETVLDVELLAAGPQGPAGQGVVPGGTTGQVLRKASGSDYDTAWSTLGKADVGLGNVDNTSDASKPVSTAQATAIGVKADKTYVDTQDSANAAATAAKYTKPVNGIPKTDLESAVQTSLGRADNGVQKTGNESVAGTKTFTDSPVINDPTGSKVTLVGSAGSQADVASFNGAQNDKILPDGTNYRRGPQVYDVQAVAATSSVPAVEAPYYQMRSRYWNGSASVSFLTYLRTIMSAANPTIQSRAGLFVNNVERMSMLANGFNGIGTTSPTCAWEVNGAIKGAIFDRGGSVFHVNAYGAVADCVKLASAASIATGDTALTVTGAAFLSTDVGKTVTVAGADSSNDTLVTTIKTVVDATHVVLNVPATQTATNTNFAYGTANSTAFMAAINAAVAVGGRAKAGYGKYLIESALTKDADDVWLDGCGHGRTELVNAIPYGNTVVNFGNSSGPTGRRNVKVTNMTIDMNYKYRTWGVGASWCRDVTIAHLRFKNVFHAASGAGVYSMIYVGTFANSNSSWPANNILIDDVIVDYQGVDTGWEAVTLGLAKNVLVRKCRFYNKPGAYQALLNYNSEYVTFQDCYFFAANAKLSGRGPNQVLGCMFENSKLVLGAADNTFVGAGTSFTNTTDVTSGTGIDFLGQYFPIGFNELPFYITTPYSWSCKNIIIDGCNFNGCNAYAIAASATSNDGQTTPALESLTLTNNNFTRSYWDGMNIKVTGTLIVAGNRAYNNGQLNQPSVAQNYNLAAKIGIFANNFSYDSQGTPTITRDLVLDITTSYVPTQKWYMGVNALEVKAGVVSYFTSTGLTDAPQGSVTLVRVLDSSRQIIAGTGLVGGGDLSADRTLSVAYGTTAGTAVQGNDARLNPTSLIIALG